MGGVLFWSRYLLSYGFEKRLIAQERLFKSIREKLPDVLGPLSADTLFSNTEDHRLRELQALSGDINPRLAGGSPLVQKWLNLTEGDTQLHISGSFTLQEETSKNRQQVQALIRCNLPIEIVGLGEVPTAPDSTTLVCNVIASVRDVLDLKPFATIFPRESRFLLLKN